MILFLGKRHLFSRCQLQGLLCGTSTDGEFKEPVTVEDGEAFPLPDCRVVVYQWVLMAGTLNGEGFIREFLDVLFPNIGNGVSKLVEVQDFTDGVAVIEDGFRYVQGPDRWCGFSDLHGPNSICYAGSGRSKERESIKALVGVPPFCFLVQIIEAIADNRNHYQKESREQKRAKRIY